VIISGQEIRLAIPDRMPLVSILVMLALWIVAVGLTGAIIYGMVTHSPDDRVLFISIGLIVAFLASIGIIGGFLAGWYIAKRKGPLAVYMLGSDEIHFPQMRVTVNRHDVVAIEMVHGKYGNRQQAHEGPNWRRLRQVFCHTRSESDQRVIVHSDTGNHERVWRQFAQELGVPFERHDLPKAKWPHVEV